MERKEYYPQGVTVANIANSISSDYGQDSATAFDDGCGLFGDVSERMIGIGGKDYHYVTWGADDCMPYRVKEKLGENMITAQCQAYNILCCYGQGVRFVDRDTRKDVADREVLDFCLKNSLQEVFMEQATDMKYWFWCATLITLTGDGKKIAKMEALDVMNCRLEYAPSTKSGKIEHLFYGDWKSSKMDAKKFKAFELLSFKNPIGDLMVRMGLEADPETGAKRPAAKTRQFAIVSRMATPGCQYYPRPFYMSVLTDAWLDIYRLIGIGKRHMIKNTSAPRMQIEVHEEYWDAVCDNENITDPVKRAERKKKEHHDIVDFVTGVENAGKALVSSYRIDPNGKENRMVRINPIFGGEKKEGGNWSDDMSEASNALCFAFGVHPNLVGATPGKSQMNNSGSDKRELFTLKQATEKPFHDIMLKPYHLLLHYNGWADRCTVDVPMIQLTTLDEKKDAKKVTNSNTDSDGNN